MALRYILFIRILLSRLLVIGELPLRVSLFHAINDRSGFLAYVEGSAGLQELKPFGEVVDEPKLSRFIEQLKRPKRFNDHASVITLSKIWGKMWSQPINTR
jgi:hypothetical protein